MFNVVAPRVISNFALSTAFLFSLFFGVIFLHMAINAMLRNAGLEGGLSLLLAGGLAFVLVVSAWVVGQDLLAQRRRRHEAEREALGLPDGPCCVIARTTEGAEMPWAMTTAVQVDYPRAARRFGIEGMAVVDFEVSADGRPKNLHCIDVWPHRIFYEAAAKALLQARFRARPGAKPRFGPTYRMPFVFRIQGGSSVRDLGRRAKTRRR
jgi:TonB family protein